MVTGRNPLPLADNGFGIDYIGIFNYFVHLSGLDKGGNNYCLLCSNEHLR